MNDFVSLFLSAKIVFPFFLRFSFFFSKHQSFFFVVSLFSSVFFRSSVGLFSSPLWNLSERTQLLLLLLLEIEISFSSKLCCPFLFFFREKRERRERERERAFVLLVAVDKSSVMTVLLLRLLLLLKTNGLRMQNSSTARREKNRAKTRDIRL